MNDQVWHKPSPDKEPILTRDEVHVWRAPLDVSPSYLQRLWPLLSADERARADRFRFAKDRHHYIAGRGILRLLLSRYVNREPHLLRFQYNAYDKPALAPEADTEHALFNLSHSHTLALYAITRDREVGIDLEFMRPLEDAEEIARQFFSERENAVFRALPEAMKHPAFFACWTRKEAYIKARGQGLSLPLDAFDVSVAPDEPAAILHTEEDPAEAARWSLKALYPDPAYQATLAVERHGWDLVCWQWPEPSTRRKGE